jgi:ribonucleotide monophosphatase NagD (HAD superfamily)
METILVFTGVTTREIAERFPYRASQVAESVADLVDQLGCEWARAARACRAHAAAC